MTRNSSFFKKFQGKIETSLKGKITGSRDREQCYQQQRNSGQEKRFELAVEIIPDVVPEVVEEEQGEQEQEEIEDIPNRRGWHHCIDLKYSRTITYREILKIPGLSSLGPVSPTSH